MAIGSISGGRRSRVSQITAGLLYRARAFLLPSRRSIPFAAFVTVVAIGALLGLLPLTSDPVERMEWALYDLFMRRAANQGETAPGIVVVAIDELSFQEVGLPWPWPRSLHATLIRVLHEAGARAIVLDMVFDQLSDHFDDETLVSSVRSAENVILAGDFAVVEDPQYSVRKVIGPYPELHDAAVAVGIVGLFLDPDGVVRRVPITVESRPGLALATLQQFDPSAGGHAATQNDDPRLIRYRGPARHGVRTVSYYQALRPDLYLPPGLFRDSVVLVGFSLAAAAAIEQAADHYMTPFGAVMSGVEIHANVLDNLLHNRFVRDPFTSNTAVAAFSLTSAMLVGLLLYRVRPLFGFVVVVLAWSVVLIGAYGVFDAANARIPVVAPTLNIAVMFAVILAYRTVYGINERRQIVGAFKHYLAPAIVERILDDPSQLKLGGSEYDTTILFSDLAGFTTISEKLPPSVITAILSDYLEEMMAVLLSKGATLDKFIGDAIMVYFGCPVADDGHPQQACEAACLMQQKLTEFNRRQQERGFSPLTMRIGINTGTVVAGNMGTRSIFNFTVIGDSVNLAARLEGINKYYGTSILISDSTEQRLADRLVRRELDRITVKGKSEAIRLYQLVGFQQDVCGETLKLFDDYAAALDMYRRQDWRGAIAALSAILAVHNDLPSATLMQRCRRYLSSPPPQNWGGVYVFDSK